MYTWKPKGESLFLSFFLTLSSSLLCFISSLISGVSMHEGHGGTLLFEDTSHWTPASVIVIKETAALAAEPALPHGGLRWLHVPHASSPWRRCDPPGFFRIPVLPFYSSRSSWRAKRRSWGLQTSARRCVSFVGRLSADKSTSHSA